MIVTNHFFVSSCLFCQPTKLIGRTEGLKSTYIPINTLPIIEKRTIFNKNIPKYQRPDFQISDENFV